MEKYERAIREKLTFLYGKKIAEETYSKLQNLFLKYQKSIPKRGFHFSEKDVVLITYGDGFLSSKKRPLHVLADFLNDYLKDVFTIVHILPFFPYSSDDGFSVIDYKKVNPSLGKWENIDEIKENFSLMFDAVINHISAKSREFLGFMKGNPKYKEFFIVVEPKTDVSHVFRPRALPLLTKFETKWGVQNLWTTFSTDQIDLNYKNPDVLLFIIDVLLFYIAHGASLIRLDAIAYLWKEVGTGCIHLPQTHTVIKLFRNIFDLIAPHAKIITETNVPHRENISYFGNGTDEAHLVYNFALPPLAVHTLITGDASILSRWAKTLETPGENTFFYNFTASHDGIGLLPAQDLLTVPQIEKMIKTTQKRGGRVGYKNNVDGTRSAYELNISLFDLLSDQASDEALNIKVSRFVASQGIALSLKGLPAIYYHSIAGSQNYYEGVEKTGINRAINREKLNLTNMLKELQADGTVRNLVFHKLTQLIKIRRKHRAFHPQGKQRVLNLHPQIFALERYSPDGEELILSLINVSKRGIDLDFRHPCTRDLLSGRIFSDKIFIEPFEILWLQRYPQN